MFDLVHLSRIIQFPGFWQGKKQNEGRRSQLSVFSDICSGKSYFVNLLGNKVYQNKHK